MNFAVDRKHRDVYRKQQWIELEGLLSKSQLHTISDGINAAIAERSKPHKGAISHLSAESQFLNGHDVWRVSQTLKKVILSKAFAETCSAIIEQKPLRIAYDQVYKVPADNKIGIGAYSTLLASTPTLQELSSIQGTLCGLILCIDGPSQEPAKMDQNPEKTLSSSLFSLVPGNGVMFSTQLPIPFSELTKRPGYTYLMIVYAQSKSVYIHQESDPHLNEFKKLGYSFGDKLSDLLNPIVYS